MDGEGPRGGGPEGRPVRRAHRRVPVMWFTYGQCDRGATVRDHWMRGRALSKSNEPVAGEGGAVDAVVAVVAVVAVMRGEWAAHGPGDHDM